jgi:hypothetical protein
MYRAAAAANASGELFAVRCGTHKAHWATKGVDPPNGTSCVPANGPSDLGHIYKCDPPIVFDLVSDPGENHPLDSSSAQYKAAMQTIGAARATHLASIRSVLCFGYPPPNTPTVPLRGSAMARSGSECGANSQILVVAGLSWMRTAKVRTRPSRSARRRTATSRCHTCLAARSRLRPGSHRGSARARRAARATAACPQNATPPPHHPRGQIIEAHSHLKNNTPFVCGNSAAHHAGVLVILLRCMALSVASRYNFGWGARAGGCVVAVGVAVAVSMCVAQGLGRNSTPTFARNLYATSRPTSAVAPEKNLREKS